MSEVVALGLAGASLVVAVLSYLRVKQVEQRQDERNDVTWATELRGNTWVLKNAGEDPAVDVDYYLTVDGTPKHRKLSQVGGLAETEAFDLTDHIARRQAQQHRDSNGNGSEPPVLLLSERILWKTPAGAQHRADPPPKEIEL